MSTLADELKFEVALPDELGDNLLTNTSGQYGAWQWARADGTSGISITGDAVARTITAQRNATAGLTAVWTDYLPVTPGLYANARVDLLAITSGHKVTLGLQFYNSTHTVISAQYSSPSSTLATLAFSSVTIPASASYARLVVVLDKTADPIPNSGSANANALVRFTRAMLTELATAGTPSVVITNLVPTGGFQVTHTGWVAGTNMASVSRIDTGGGAWVLRGESAEVTLSDNEKCYINSPYIGIEAGAKYSMRIDVRADVMTDGHTLTPGLLYRWVNDAGTVIGGDNVIDSSVTNGAWVQFWRVITAPAGATKIRFHPYMQHHGAPIAIAAGWDFDVDSVSLVKSSVLQPFFDGNTPDTSSHVYAWTGTVGNSPSTRTSVGAVDYVETDEQYIDILAGVVTIETERTELDVSTFNARLVDVAMSPARAGSAVRPGRKFRLSALKADGVTWGRLFTGTLGPAKVTYEPLEDARRLERDPGRTLNISVTGTGYESVLAQASRPAVTRTPANLADLVLAGAGVPWNINGSTNTVGGVVSIATDDSATALDQVALTRDTVSGAAWVDPEGTLQFRTTRPTELAGTLDEDAYTADGLVVGFDTSRVINSLNIIRVIRASDGSTEERQHGPYENAASIREWGRHAPAGGAIKIASVPDDTAAADTRAAHILASNANPELLVEEVAVNSADTRAHAFHDLYARLHLDITTVDGVISASHRVVKVRHEISTARRRHGNWGTWRTIYGFQAYGAIASPAILPPPSYGVEGGWTNIPLRSGFTAVAGETPQYKKEGNVVWLRGRLTGTFPTGGVAVGDLPVGFRPTIANELWSTSFGTNAIPGRFFVGDGGALTVDPETATSEAVPISTAYRTD